MTSTIFAPGFKTVPYWWEAEQGNNVALHPLPSRCDVVIAGSGFTGLSAALTLARAGREVVVIEAENPGFGCSTRNGGHIGSGIRNTYKELVASHGREMAYAIKREGRDAYKYLLDLIAEEKIACGLSRNGHCIGAHTQRSVARLKALAESEPPDIEPFRFIAKDEARQEIGSSVFHGALVLPDRGGLDPKLYHMGLLQSVERAGVKLVTRTTLLSIAGSPDNFSVSTSRGDIKSRNVLIATNGYTRKATPWWQRRIIPIGSYMIATEPLNPDLVKSLFPKGYQMNDTRKVIYFYRASPDGRRVLFGGRVALQETDPAFSAPRLHAAMAKVFPQLQNVRLSHSWMGFIAYTFDSLPHFGTHDGIHYAMGYCGNGISMSTYLGNKTANLLLKRTGADSVLKNRKFSTRPLYTGNPWFLAPAIAFYKARDLLWA